MDVKNRTPLHFALSNAGRKASPGAVRHLLTLDRRLVNSIRGGPLPLRVLSEFAYTLRKNGTEEDKANVVKCLEHLLNAEPNPTADFFTTLQGLPHWLGEKAVVMASVQVLLNDKISQRFPTFVLMCDFFCLLLVIVFYSIDIFFSIEARVDSSQNDAIAIQYLIPLYFGAAYFLGREVIQVLSLISLKVRSSPVLFVSPLQAHPARGLESEHFMLLLQKLYLYAFSPIFLFFVPSHFTFGCTISPIGSTLSLSSS